MPRIAVEGNLQNVRKALQNNGFDVVSMDNSSDIGNADCCVVSGVDSNMMGIENTFTKVPVINAEGMSEQQIVEQVRSRIQKH